MRLKGCTCKKCPHVVQKSIHVRASKTNRYRDVDRDDRIASRSQGTREGESPRQLGLRATQAGKGLRRLRGRLAQLAVVLDGRRFAGAVIGHRVRRIAIRGIGLSVNGQSHNDFLSALSRLGTEWITPEGCHLKTLTIF